MDGNIPQHYEVKQEQLGGVINPQEQLNKLQEEYRKSVIQGMDDDLRSGGKYEEIKNDLQYDVVGNIGVVIYKGEPYAWYKYSKERGVEYYTNVEGIGSTVLMERGKRDSGYELNNGELFKNGQKINQFLNTGNVNPEFVRGVDNLNFYLEIQNTFGLMKSTIEGDNVNYSIKGMNLSIVSGVMRIKDIVYFAGNRDKISLDEKGTKLTDENIKALLHRAILELPNQCSDTRFYQSAQGIRMGMEVTKEELDEYLNPTEGAPLITQSIYDECLKRIEVRDKKIAEMNGVKEASKVERKIENERMGVLEKVKGILGNLFE